MSDEITPHAHPIANTGEPEWFPPPEDDQVAIDRPKPSTVRTIFRGPDGLRAGWVLLLWFLFIGLIGAVVTKTLHALLNGRIPPHTTPEWLLMTNSAMLFLITGTAGYIVSRIEGRTWSEYGFGPLRGRFREFVVGLFWGFAMLSLLVGALWKSGFLVFHGFVLHGAGSIVLWALLFAVSFLFTGFFEEFAFRGFPQFTLTRGIAGILRAVGMEDHAKAVAFWITAILMAILFGAVHASNDGEAKMGVYAAGVIGFVFAFSVWRTGSLWWAIGFHTAWDWAESYFYGTADSGMSLPHRLMTAVPQGNVFYSGGTVGPEGSVFVWGAVVLTALVIALTLKPQPGSPAADVATGM
jgi:membrane protease YdiL (CAAX protease family)